MTASSLSTKTPATETTLAKTEHIDEAWTLLNEYFEAAQVEVRDSKQSISAQLENGAGQIWIAYSNGEAAGCIALRPLAEHTGEVKRLYVRPQFRRLGIAAGLLAALESHACKLGLHSLYLDSKDDLKAAIIFYERAGYTRCERYNDNPQATIFLQKRLGTSIVVRAFLPGDEAAFCALNEAWISKLFRLEEKDTHTLREPQKYILSKGGKIYMACRKGKPVGCCALLAMSDGGFELAKMGVAESERGKGVGRTLLDYVIAAARRSGSTRLYLETNHALVNAIHLYESVGFTHLKPEDIIPSPYVRADVYMEMRLA